MIDSYHCNTKTIDFVLEIKQTRTILKQVLKEYTELKEEVPEGIIVTGCQMLSDWRDLVKYHRKRTFSAMLSQDLENIYQLEQGLNQYTLNYNEDFRFVNDEGQDLLKELSIKDSLISLSSLENSKT